MEVERCEDMSFCVCVSTCIAYIQTYVERKAFPSDIEMSVWVCAEIYMCVSLHVIPLHFDSSV